MSPHIEVALVSGREIKKNLRGVKGIVLTFLSLVGGTLVAYGVMKAIGAQVQSGDTEKMQKAMALRVLYSDEATATFLADAPTSLITLLQLSVWLTPGLVWLSGFDGVAGEVQYRTIRYWSIRTRRASFYVGKLLGLWLTVAAITLLMHLVMTAIAIVGAPSEAASILAWEMRFWFVAAAIALPWSAVAVLVGSLMRTPISALLLVGFSYFALFFVGYLIPHYRSATNGGAADTLGKVLSYAYPNTFEGLLLSPSFERLGIGVLGCLAFAAVPSLAGALLFKEQDI